jgi:outer membrane protein TolC
MILRENMELLQSIESAIRVRYITSTAGNPNLIQTQVEIGKLEDRLRSLESLRPVITSQLNSALGRDTGAHVPWPRRMPEEAVALEEEELIATIAEDNPVIQAARERVQAAREKRRLATKQYYPDFGLGLSVMQTGRRQDMDPEDNGKDPVGFMFEMTIPIWRGKYSAGVHEANAKRQEAERSLENLTNKLSSDLQTALYHYRDAGRKLDLFRNTLIPKGEEAFHSMQTAFIAGNVDFAGLIDAERTLLELRLMVERALVDRAIRLAELEMLSGRELRMEEGEKR